MFLSVTLSAEPDDGIDATDNFDATDLGHLLHKHPDRAQSFPVSGGTAHVFYPEAAPQRCTAVLLPRGRPDRPGPAESRVGRPGESGALRGDDRPYAASSLLAVAIAKVFGTAMSGRSESRPELAARPLSLQFRIPALPCRGGPELARRMFEPLGWTVRAEQPVLDPAFPSWGSSGYLDVHLSGRTRLADSLGALYVLLPVLDDAKHYWVTTDEVDKLVRAGQGWLAGHPDRDLIIRRYLSHRRGLVATAVDRLAAIDDTDEQALEPTDDQAVDEAPAADPDEAEALEPGRDGRTGETAAPEPAETAAPEPAERGRPKRRRPNRARLRLPSSDGRRCSGCCAPPAPAVSPTSGAGTQRCWRCSCATVPSPTSRASTSLCGHCEMAARRLRLDRLSDRDRTRLSLFQSSLTYRDRRLADHDAAVLMEVVEHVDPPRSRRSNAACSPRPGHGQWLSPPPTPSTTCGSRAFQPARFAIGTTASSGPGSSFGSGRKRSAGSIGTRRG